MFHSLFFFSSRRRHTRSKRDWSSDVCSSDLIGLPAALLRRVGAVPSYYLKYFYAHDAVVARQREERPRAVAVAETERELLRSEERRVGKEWRSRWTPCE